MGRVKKRIPSYSFWDLDTGKKVHAQYYIFGEMGYSDQLQKPFRINHFAIRWIKRGGGKVMVDHIPVVLTKNLLFMGNPSQITQYEIDLEEDLEAMIIAFTDELLSLMGFEQEGISLIYQLSNQLELYPEGHDKFMLDQIFTMIFEEFNSKEDTMFKDEIMASMVRILIQYLFRIKSRKELNKEGLRYRNLYRNFIDAIENNFREIHKVSEYVELLYVSEKTINRSCKALTNITANKIIQNRIDFEAKRMLARKDVNIKQIGYDLGFKSSSHFNKFFKNINSITPGSFRKNILD